MKKALYLKAVDNWQLSWDDEAFYLARKGKAARAVPIRTIERIVLMGEFALTTTLLINLARRDIPVSIVDGHGFVRAMIAPATLPDTLLKRRQVRVFTDPGRQRFIQAWYRVWQDRLDRLAMLKVRKRLPRILSRGHLHRLFESRVSGIEREAFHHAVDRVTALFFSFILKRISQQGLDADIGIFRQNISNSLVWEIVRLFEGECYYQAWRHVAGESRRTRVLVHRFEERLKVIAPLIARLFEELLQQITAPDHVPLFDHI